MAGLAGRPETTGENMDKRLRRSLQAVLIAALAVCEGAGADAAKLDTAVTGTAHEALFGIASQNNSIVAVGAGGAILASADRGATWKTVMPAPTPLSLLGVAIAPGHALTVGQMGTVLRLDDNGHWQKVDSGTDARLFSVAVNDKGRAIAVGSFGTIIESDDGGSSWKAVAPDWTPYTQDGAQPHLYAAAVDEAGVLTVAGEFGLIVRSSDAGASWQVLHKGDASLFALDLHDPAAGFAVGQTGTVLRTTDGGKTWSDASSGTDASLLGVRAVGGGHVVVTGIRELLASTDGGQTWQRISNPDIATSWYQGVDANGDGGAWIVGHSGRILRLGS